MILIPILGQLLYHYKKGFVPKGDYSQSTTTVTIERAGIDNDFNECLPMYCKSLLIDVTYNFPFRALSHFKEMLFSVSA